MDKSLNKRCDFKFKKKHLFTVSKVATEGRKSGSVVIILFWWCCSTVPCYSAEQCHVIAQHSAML
jgi:hypothetical protein